MEKLYFEHFYYRFFSGGRAGGYVDGPLRASLYRHNILHGCMLCLRCTAAATRYYTNKYNRSTTTIIITNMNSRCIMFAYYIIK